MKLMWKGSSAIAGETKWMEADEELRNIPVVSAFVADEDLQEMTIASGNIGFVKTFQKWPDGAKEGDPV